MAGSRARIDFAAVAATANARAEQLVREWLSNGNKRGDRWYVGGLSNEKGKSLVIEIGGANVGRWSDFSTGDAGGDLIALYAAVRGLKQLEAARELAQQFGMHPSGGHGKASIPAPQQVQQVEAKAPAADKDEKADTWRDAGPAPASAPPPKRHPHRGEPVASWCYRNAEGQVLGYVHRFTTSDGGKEVLPVVWSKHPEKGYGWRWRAFSELRPLYGLDLLAQHPERPVLIVEGEKCADAARSVLGVSCVVVTWPGGTNATFKADWSPLKGRRVVIWPDCDAKRDKTTGDLLPPDKQPGLKAAHKIAEQLAQLGCDDVRLVDVPAPGTVLDGWDVADCITEAATPEAATIAVRTWLRTLVPSPYRPTDPNKAARAGGELVPGSPDEPPPPVELEPASWRAQLLEERGKLVRHPANVVLILRNEERWRGVVAYDEFAQVTVKRQVPPYQFGRTGEWDAEDDTRTAVWLAQHYRLDVTSATVTEAVEMLARESRFHPVREYLEGLPAPATDGERLLPHWLTRFVGVTDSPYTQCVAQYFLRGMVKRVMEPGCKFDYCLVLEGAEGLRKSTLAATLGGPWGSDVPLDLSNNREAAAALHGHWVMEFSEMESVSRAEAHLQKSFLSRQFDQYRPVYGRRNIKVPRQCVFIGTTNETEYVKDGAGARRFWPVTVTGPIDIEGLRAALPQLMAEALADYRAGERAYPSAEEQVELFRPMQAARVVAEGLVDALHDWVLHPTTDEVSVRQSEGGMFSLSAAAYRGLKISYAQLTRDLQTRIGKALAALGCERIEKRNGTVRYWYKPPQKVATSSAPARPSTNLPPEAAEGVPF